MFLTQLIRVLIYLCLASTAYGSNALRGKNFSPTVDSKPKELKINKEFVKQGREADITKQDIAAIVPLDLSTTNDGRMVRDKILIKSANSIVKSPMVRESFLMKTAKTVEKSAKVDMAIKAQPTVTNTNPIQHKFKFDLQAFKKEAKFIYTGYVDSRVEYKLKEDALQISIEEKLSQNSRIAFTHQKNKWEQRQYVNYQINW